MSRVLATLIVVLYSNAAYGQERTNAANPGLFNLAGLNLPQLNFSLPTLISAAPCVGTSSLRQGFCRTSGECDRVGGVIDGSCAAGFGSCCVNAFKCGATTLFNNSYFSNAEYPEASKSSQMCSLVVQKLPNTVQLRIEFESFELAAPGADGSCATDAMTVEGCNADFSIPRICGKNSGQHLVFPVDKSSGDLITIRFALSGSGSSKWQMKIMQLEKLSHLLAPSGCLQYHHGKTEGKISSFNYDSQKRANNLAGLRYSICFRKEAGYCGVRFEPPRIRSERHTYAKPMHSYRHQYYLHPTQYMIRHPQVYHHKRPHNYYYYPIAAQQHGHTYRPPYQAPFPSGWKPENNSVYVPPLEPPTGNTTVPTNSTEGTTEPTPPMNVTEPIGNVTEPSVNVTESVPPVTPIVDVPSPEPDACHDQDTVCFPLSKTMCDSSGLNRVTVNVSPLVVYVSNDGKSHGKGFHLLYNYLAC
ncbi:hypothetical protein HDE_10363 [Halotydeus destructor]|nr:hypothetical protein HDE_10363 [Halotydeus destructor]